MDDFWCLIESARADAKNCCAVVSNATALPAARRVPEIISFHQAWLRLVDASYQRDLWAAAHLIPHGCSDDSFDYFRAYLLTQGRHVFESAVAVPDSLATFDLLPEPYGGVGYCEDALYIAWAAHRIATGEDMPAVARTRGELPTVNLDRDFDDDAEMRRRLPRLSAFYLR